MVTAEAMKAFHHEAMAMKTRVASRARTANAGMRKRIGLGQVIIIEVGDPEGGQEEYHCQEQDQGPDFLGHGTSLGLKLAFRLGGEPQRAVHGKNGREEQTTHEAVRVEQGKEIPLEDPLAINGQSFKQVGKGHPQKAAPAGSSPPPGRRPRCTATWDHPPCPGTQKSRP